MNGLSKLWEERYLLWGQRQVKRGNFMVNGLARDPQNPSTGGSDLLVALNGAFWTVSTSQDCCPPGFSEHCATLIQRDKVSRD